MFRLQFIFPHDQQRIFVVSSISEGLSTSLTDDAIKTYIYTVTESSDKLLTQLDNLS